MSDRTPLHLRVAVGICVLLTAFGVLPGSPALAAPAPGPSPAPTDGFSFAVQPSGPDGPTGRNYFVYDATPGQRIADHVALINLGRQPLSFTVYGTDAFNTPNGEFALLAASQRPVDVGAWVAVGAAEHTVPPGGRVIVPFTLTIPENATPGDHVGGVIGSMRMLQTTATGQTVTVDRRVAARIYLRIAGPLWPGLQVEELRIDHHNTLNPFGGGEMTVTYQLRNTGNVRLAGDSNVTVTGPFGWRLAGTGALAVPELLPGNAFTVTERVTGLAPAGRLTASVAVAPRDGEQALPGVERSASVWAVPWVLIAVLLVIAALLAYPRIRRRRAAARTTAAPDAALPDRANPDAEPAQRP